MGAIDKLPHFLEICHDLKMDGIMFRKDLFKDWTSSHLVDYGWYFDSPKEGTLAFEIYLQEWNELSFQSSKWHFPSKQQH